ncbi:NAD(P)-binding domain-containing protein [Streptomyces torulosus]|uniref:NAD(P)-binding domain-containing protein n=1 Tax=Streptomyces torulosus TaxID=68276 RepID=UPI003B8372AB
MCYVQRERLLRFGVGRAPAFVCSLSSARLRPCSFACPPSARASPPPYSHRWTSRSARDEETPSMATLGFIGSGNIGMAVARLAVAAGIDVVLSNSRGPETLAEAVAELGGRARAATPEEAARAGDWVVVSVPLSAYRNLPADALAGKVVLDTSNYYPMRDGTIEVLDSGKKLTTVFVSHGDPDFYFGAEVIADAFPDAVFVATPHVIEHIRHSYEGKLKAWAALGPNLPTRLVDLTPLTGDLTMEGHRFELKGGPAALPDRHYLWQAGSRTLLGGVLLFQHEHVWVADTPAPGDRAAWIDLLDEMAALDPELVVPGHRLPGTPADASAIAATREYLLSFEEELGKATDGAALTEALVARYPDNGMGIAAQIGAKVAKGEMTWG